MSSYTKRFTDTHRVTHLLVFNGVSFMVTMTPATNGGYTTADASFKEQVYSRFPNEPEQVYELLEDLMWAEDDETPDILHALATFEAAQPSIEQLKQENEQLQKDVAFWRRLAESCECDQ